MDFSLCAFAPLREFSFFRVRLPSTFELRLVNFHLPFALRSEFGQIESFGLFSDAKLPKDAIEDVVGVNSADDLP